MTRDSSPQRILIVRPSALGDVCRSVGVLASLHGAFPDARIDWLVQDDFAAAIAAHPALHEAILFPRSRFAHWWRSPGRAWELWNWFNRLRKRRYDLVLDCQGLGRSGLMTFATGAPRRVGLRQAREGAWLGYNIRAPRNKAATVPIHTVDQMLLLVEELGITPVRDMRLYVREPDKQSWRDRASALGLRQGRYAILAPTSRWLSKRWPIERFTQLIEPLAKRGFERVIVIGSASEVDQVKPLVDQPFQLNQRPYIENLVGKTGIGETMAIIADAALVIANDSAPLHMAVGLDRPCVGLYGPTDPAAVGPYQQPEAVLRGYHPRPNEAINFKDARLGDSLMRFISVVAVLQQIDRVLSFDRIQSQDSDGAKPQAADFAKGAAS